MAEVAAAGTPAQPPPPPAGASPPATVTHVLECPPANVGRVIGRGGEVIRDLQARTGARIWIDCSMPEPLPRKVMIEGPEPKATSAVGLVQLVIDNGPGGLSAAASAGGTSQTLDAERSLIGRLVGHRGETIADVERRTGARLQIDQSGPDGAPAQIKVFARLLQGGGGGGEGGARAGARAGARGRQKKPARALVSPKPPRGVLSRPAAPLAVSRR